MRGTVYEFFFAYLFTPITSCVSPTLFTSDYRSGLTSGFISNTDEGFHLVLRDDTTILTDISSISILVNTSTTTARIYTGNMTQTLGLASAVGELKRDGEGDDG